MGLTKIGTDGVKDDAITSGKIPANAVGSSELAAGCINNSNLFSGAVVNTAQIVNNAVTADEIADQAVTLAKLPHGTSSNDGKFLRANNGADPTFETVTSTTINNNADNRVITGSGTANTLEGEATLTYNGTDTFELQPASATPAIFIGDSNRSGAGQGLVQYKGNWNGTTVARITMDSGSDTTNKDDGIIRFDTAASGSVTERMRILSNGGITFNGDTAAANALDDYEEGSWTPQIRRYVNGSFGTAASMTDNGTVQRSTYTKIGNVVTLYLQWDGFQQSNANYAALGGLPYNTAYSGGGGGSVGYTNAFTNNQNLGILVGSDSDILYFYINNNSWNAWSTSSNRAIYLQATYLTT